MARPKRPAAPAEAPRPVARYYHARQFVDGTLYVEEDSAGAATVVTKTGGRAPWSGSFAALAAALVASGAWRKEVLS